MFHRLTGLLALALLCAPLTAQSVVFVDADATGAADGSSWADAYTSLAAGLADASAGEQVWVAAGTYVPTVQSLPGVARSVTFSLPDGVEVYGGFAGTETALAQRDPDANPTILSGELASAGAFDNALHVVTVEAATSTLIDGFIVRDGTATGEDAQDQRGAGLVAFGGGDVTVRGCTFTANASAITGADLATFDDADPIIDGCTFSGSSSGMRLNGGTPEITDSLFENHGGISIYISENAQFSITDSTFTGNTGTSDSVRVIGSAQGEILRCDFVDSSASGLGTFGAGVLLVEDCLFENNVTAGSGAAVGIDQTAPGSLFRRCDFIGNATGANGGAVWADGTVIDIDRCRFIDNTADGVGGALALTFESIGGFSGSRVTNSLFLGNSATSGGGATSATGGQGGFMVWGSSPEFVNCVFSGNVGGLGGVAYVNGESEPRFVNCSLAGNVATEAAGALYGKPEGFIPEPGVPRVRVHNSILWGNSDPFGSGQGSQIVNDGAVFPIDHSCVQGWDGTLGGVGNHGLDPFFLDADGPDDIVGTEDDDLRLPSGSPCIDAGNASTLLTDATDLDCDGDVAEDTSLDLALVRRREDDSNTPDTGTGNVPLVDMGAYERSVWANDGRALAGAAGEPCLVGVGNLVAGSTADHRLTNAAPSVPALFFFGFTKIEVPFKKGVLVPAPDILVTLPTSASGTSALPFTWPAGVPAGVNFTIQYWIPDAGAPAGLAASNAITATTP